MTIASQTVVHYLVDNPMSSASKISKGTGMAYSTASRHCMILLANKVIGAKTIKRGYMTVTVYWVLVGESGGASNTSNTPYPRPTDEDTERILGRLRKYDTPKTLYSDAYFRKITQGALPQLRRWIPEDLQEHTSLILEEYKKAWLILKDGRALVGLRRIRFLHAVIVHCMRKYGWRVKSKYGRPVRSQFHHVWMLMFEKENSLKRTHGGSGHRTNYYAALCRAIPEYQQVKDDYYANRRIVGVFVE